MDAVYLHHALFRDDFKNYKFEGGVAFMLSDMKTPLNWFFVHFNIVGQCFTLNRALYAVPAPIPVSKLGWGICLG